MMQTSRPCQAADQRFAALLRAGRRAQAVEHVSLGAGHATPEVVARCSDCSRCSRSYTCPAVPCTAPHSAERGRSPALGLSGPRPSPAAQRRHERVAEHHPASPAWAAVEPLRRAHGRARPPVGGLYCLIEASLPELDQPDALNNIGFMLLSLGEQEHAEQVLLYTAATWPQFAPPWVNLARLYVDRRDGPRAQECLRHSRETAPGASENEELAGRIAIQQGDPTPRSAVVWPPRPQAAAAAGHRAARRLSRPSGYGARAAAVLPQHFVELPQLEGGTTSSCRSYMTPTRARPLHYTGIAAAPRQTRPYRRSGTSSANIRPFSSARTLRPGDNIGCSARVHRACTTCAAMRMQRDYALSCRAQRLYDDGPCTASP